MQDDYVDPIYKGGTALSTILGVPLLPFILGALVIGQLTVLGFFFFRMSVGLSVLVVGVILFGWARQVGKNDEWRLMQLLMKARMRGPQKGVRKFWGAVSFSPHSPRK